MGKPIHCRIAPISAMRQVLNCLALQTGRRSQQPAGKTFGDLLEKQRRPATLIDTLRERGRMQPANEQPSATIRRLRRP
jgi:hypothetical protein